MNKQSLFVTAVISVILFSLPARAYELGTHARLTENAYVRSTLFTDPQLLKSLGLRDEANPFGEAYYDVSGTEVRERKQNNFENLLMSNPEEKLTIKGWLMRGAIREDDLGQIFGINVGSNPQDDPYGNIFRVRNHFYDPIFDRPLTVATALGEKAPNWALGSTNAFADPIQPNTSRRNHFTVFDAREAMYRALTGKNKAGQDVAINKDERNKYWATLFRALGDIVHLAQDMGQPQHTRNDPHAGYGAGHKSIYELYLDCRATGNLTREVKSNGVKQCNPLTYVGYPLPTLTKYSDYFSTRTGINGKGLADYSNRGFFSAGSNLGSNLYSLPSNSAGSYTQESTAIAGLTPNNPLVEMNFLRGNVSDTQVPGSANIRLTTQSVFDSFLGTTKSYHLNRYNYNEMANLLIPRAVAYSAGLIDYFFRGRLQPIDAAFANSEITFKIKNAIS